MNSQRPLDTTLCYRNILILESREWWSACSQEFDPQTDLVLTYDLALQRQVSVMGGNAFYLDHLEDARRMHSNNFHTYHFFRDWHLDANGKDIFNYRNIPFGFAFRLEIWNDLLSFVSTRANLERLRELKFDRLLVGTASGLVESMLKTMEIPITAVEQLQPTVRMTYYFPIHRWMDEKVRSTKFKHKVMRAFIAIQGTLTSWGGRLIGSAHRKSSIYFQFYHPTRKIFQQMNKDPSLRLRLGHFTASSNKTKYLTERPIPIWGSPNHFEVEAKRLMDAFRSRRCAKLIMEGNIDISEGIYPIIQQRIESRIKEYLRDLDCIIGFLEKNPVQMEVMIANIGRIDTLVDCVCKQHGVPSYLIINGLMGPEYLDESKYATVINAYSQSIKDDYFRGMPNIVCLGDPRMDDYCMSVRARSLVKSCPTVTIGASGFNVIDLNSYVAVEFEFMWDVLKALQTLKSKGHEFRVIIKVRPNGYRGQYESFAAEYFPGLVSDIQDSEPMRSVLERTDLYISIYSQTLFEASCLGIPSIYYKKDTEILSAPFDGRSELVTVDNIVDLQQAIVDFKSGHQRFNAFLQREVMEKYVGPLDGKNVERNVEYIYEILHKQRTGIAS